MDEAARLHSLAEYEILDTLPEEGFDDVTKLAAQLCKTPVALIAFVDADRVWVKSRLGTDLHEVERAVALCGYAITTTGLVIEDVLSDDRFRGSAAAAKGYRSYVGVPLISPEGHHVGTLAVLDQVPRRFEAPELEALRALARQVMSNLELSKALRRQQLKTEELLQRKVVFRSLIENLNEIIFQTDIEGRWTYLSPAWNEVLGYSPAESLGAVFLDYVHPEDRHVNVEKFRLLLNREKDYCRHQVRYRRSDGEYRWVEVFARLTLDSAGKVSGTTGTLTDIHEKRLTEEHLRQEKDRLESITNHFGDVIWISDQPKNNIIYISPSFEAVWEQSCDALYANPYLFFQAIHPEDQPRIMKAFEKQPLGTYDEIYRIVTPAGEVKWIQDKAFPIRRPDGTVYRITGISRDITERIKFEEALRDQREKFETIVNNIPLFLTIYDKQGQFEWANPAFETVLGWSVEEARSRNLLNDFYPDPDRRQEVINFMSSPRHDQWMVFDTTTKAGAVIPTSWMNVRLSSGRCIGIGLDISTQRQQEKLIREQQAKIVAAAKMSSLGEMAGGVAHEINNPLTIILGNTQILKRLAELGAAKPADISEVCGKIDLTVTRIAKIISGLKTFARDGSRDPFETANLGTIVGETLGFCEARFKNNRVRLLVEPFEDEIHLECRSVEISQVLLNLLNNAFDAVVNGPDPWVRLEIRTGQELVEIVIEDSGPGIPPQIREKIMQPFFTTKEVGKGTGLGLSLSKGLVESHRGALVLDAEAPNTKFRIRLPKRQAS
jgi:PAS domain S-box-containing protein